MTVHSSESSMQISETPSSELESKKSSCWSPPRRYVVAFLAFLGFWNVYALRVNLSVAIVAMTSNYTVHLDNGTTIQRRDFDWDSKTRGLLLSSFFYGYIITQIPGGWLGARIGGALLFGAGIASTALLTLLTPLAASGGVTLLFVLRVLEGVFEGVTYPCIHAVWARWAPPLERSKLATLAFSGSYVGTVVALPLSGYLAKHVGWPYVFYVFGFIGLVWYAVWVAVVREGPELDPRISQEELIYIQKSLGQQNYKKTSPPWGQFLKSAPVWAIIVAHFAENWGFYTLLTQLPTFMKDTLEFDLKDAGLLSALPYLAMAAVLQLAGHLADWLRSKQFISTTAVRKLFNCGAFVSQTTFMMLAAYLLAPLEAVACLTVAVGLGGFAWSGFSVNHLDIAPQYASLLMGLSNTFATLPGIISPALTGIIVQNKSVEEWKIVFYIASGIYLVGAVIYAICASGERQPWAIDEEPIPAVEKSKSKEHDRYSGLYDFNAMEQLKLPRPKLHHNDINDF
ncbi:sialin-like [Neocloeon triangulifer]|uniref:sialin-like n=1 Tax=Neocloeon triangulifer TaxID=2078957 RepID=UPI00286F1846|nr:sialin-like [Neocloeon triangulifer]